VIILLFIAFLLLAIWGDRLFTWLAARWIVDNSWKYDRSMVWWAEKRLEPLDKSKNDGYIKTKNDRTGCTGPR
jgi:hypothetical protein